MGPGDSRIVIAEDARDLARKGADFFSRAVEESRDDADGFSVALSGGTTPRPMYRRLAGPPYLSDLPWQTVQVFWVDERLVPYDHADSNFGAAREDVLNRVPIPSHHLHPMPVQAGSEEGAVQYERKLKDFFQEARDGPLFDLVYLGVGKDGHTASLFPGQAVVGESDRWVLGVKGGDPLVPRLTLTLPVLNRAKRVIFMISGHEKAPVLKALWEDKDQSLPAGMIRPLYGELIWLLDREAASLLPEGVKRA